MSRKTLGISQFLLMGLFITACGTPAQGDLDHAKALLLKLPAGNVWNKQLETANSQAVKKFNQLDPKAHWSPVKLFSSFSCTPNDLTDSQGPIGIQGSLDAAWYATPTGPQHLAFEKYVETIEAIYGPLGFYYALGPSKTPPPPSITLMGPAGATVDFTEGNGATLQVGSGCRLLSHANPSAHATKQ